MRDVEIHGAIVGVEFQPNDVKDGRVVVRVAVSPMERIGKWSVWLVDGTQAPPSQRMPDPNMIEWHHLDGTVCVDGWDALTGKCSTGGGPVTPRLAVTWLSPPPIPDWAIAEADAEAKRRAESSVHPIHRGQVGDDA